MKIEINEIRDKLFSMRYTSEQMDELSMTATLMAYGYSNCINDLLEWTHKLNSSGKPDSSKASNSTRLK